MTAFDKDGKFDDGTFMWAPDAAYSEKTGKYYFYYPRPASRAFNDEWMVGVAVSDYPDHGFVDVGVPIIGIGGREADFDLLEANFDQHLEEFQLFLEAHGDDKGLIAVAQVHAAPGGSFLDVVLLDPAVITGGYRVVPRCVLGSVHHPVVLLK